ncbi:MULTISPECIES: SCO2195 family GlnR-regulated protein [Streptomyces]|uniref:Uncharacterized protein n=1 Tax=Streptomyces silvisoli TaxID=3034235 RepID=A0ABT5ZFQ1_9ACTN|nr:MULTISPECIES: hypothetical protein [Streptomyces]MDF3288501.1 hypothetical protein [Streptomyces silvisoli]
MQAHPAHAHASSTAATTTSVTGALRAVEAFLLRGGQQTARRNAWTAVLEDRRRAKDRREAQHVLETLTTSGRDGADG